jgi:hypothetical protein
MPDNDFNQIAIRSVHRSLERILEKHLGPLPALLGTSLGDAIHRALEALKAGEHPDLDEVISLPGEIAEVILVGRGMLMRFGHLERVEDEFGDVIAAVEEHLDDEARVAFSALQPQPDPQPDAVLLQKVHGLAPDLARTYHPTVAQCLMAERLILESQRRTLEVWPDLNARLGPIPKPVWETYEQLLLSVLRREMLFPHINAGLPGQCHQVLAGLLLYADSAPTRERLLDEYLQTKMRHLRHGCDPDGRGKEAQASTQLDTSAVRSVVRAWINGRNHIRWLNLYHCLCPVPQRPLLRLIVKEAVIEAGDDEVLVVVRRGLRIVPSGAPSGL